MVESDWLLLVWFCLDASVLVVSDIPAMADTPASPQVVQWILDTRDLWPGARQSRELETHVSPLNNEIAIDVPVLGFNWKH